MKVLLTYMLLVALLAAGILACRNEAEAPKEKIESITFDRERVELSINEEITARVSVLSQAAKKNETIQYTSVNEGIIEIKEPTNDGLIIKGLKSGSTVIMAKSEQVTSYLEVIVTGNVINAQYITVAQPVIEMEEGERRQTQVSLYGGSSLDNNDFVWRLENGKDNIGINVTANIAVVSGLERGNQKIIVSHPKAQFDVEIIVFVRGVDEAIKYITSSSNVLLVPNDGQYHHFEVLLYNGAQEDNILWEYSIVDGDEYVEIVPNGNVCNVLGKAAGSALIEINHPYAPVEFNIRVIVYESSVTYVTLDKTFSLMNIGDSLSVTASVENARNGTASNNQFSHEIIASANNVVEVIQTNNSFFIRARNGGNARIIISNEQSNVPREILIVVRDEIVYRDDYYITTSQNVITTQVGADDIQLHMQLMNGNTADANSFEWVVDDGTIIDVMSAHGNVSYQSRNVINSVFNAIAVITPKKAGTAKITISHPKAVDMGSVTVMVKVYPKGTFAETPIIVSAKNPDGSLKGLLTVEKGKPETVQLGMVSGDILNVGELYWSTDDTDIASVNLGTRGTVNILTGNGEGLTKMTVSGSKLEYPYEALVLAGTEEYLKNASVIYVDSIYQTILTEQTVSIPVRDSNDRYTNSDNFKAFVEDTSLLYAVMVKNQLVMQGKGVGETKVKVTHYGSLGNAMNEIMLTVRIDPATINVDRRFYINSVEILGVVRNTQSELNVTLVGADTSEYGKLEWRVDDSTVVKVLSNGATALVTGLISGQQTKIRVKHPEAGNEPDRERVIVVYVVETEAELNEKVAIGVASENYLLTVGEDKLITLITNASESQKKEFKWQLKYGEDVISNLGTRDAVTGYYDIDNNFDSAMIRTIETGNAEIVVSHPDNVIPTSIYVSVIDGYSDEKSIKGPAVIELLIGESKIVSVSHMNLTQLDISNIKWSIDDKTIATIDGNGDTAYMLGLKKGVSYVNIIQNINLNYTHKATLLCAATAAELASMYVMGVDQSYYEMTVGEEKRIRLSFGSAGFPEASKTQIAWTVETGGAAVQVVGSGEQVSVVAKEEGTVKVTVSHADAQNTLELTFKVRGVGAAQYEFKNYDRLIGMVTGTSRQVTLGLYEGNTEITHGYSLIKHTNTYDGVVKVNRVDNILDLQALSTGQSNIEVTHDNVLEKATILVYTDDSQDKVDAYYPILADKTNYLMQVGESVIVKIITLGGKQDDENLGKVQWGMENSGIVENITFNVPKKEAVLKGRSLGQGVININYNGQVVEKIYITVVSNDTVDMTKYVMTESIIGIVKGKSRETQVVTNLGSDAYQLLWETMDASIVTVSGSGEKATLQAKDTGSGIRETYVTVSYGSWLKRHILVYVCDTEEQVKAYKAMNMESQYIRLGRNEEVVLPMYFAPNKTEIPTVWEDKYGNNVVGTPKEDENGGKITITTKNEGVAVLEARNTGLSNVNRVVQIYIEVSDRYANSYNVPQVRYLTIAKPIYLLNPDIVGDQVDIGVSGIGMTVDQLNAVQWAITEGNSLVSIHPNGQNCTVRVNSFGLEGTAKLQASFVDNTVTVTVVVSKTGLVGFPYITGPDTVTVGNTATTTLDFYLAEIDSYDDNGFEYKIINGTSVATISAETGNRVSITGLTSGQATLEVKHEEARFAFPVLIVVTTTVDGIIYVTTQDNYSIIKTGEYKTLTITGVGYDNLPANDYVWQVEHNGEFYNWNAANYPTTGTHIIEKPSASGRQLQVQGKNVGTVKIKAGHNLVPKEYWLTLYVRVTYQDIVPIYLTTSRNIVSVTENSNVYLDVQMVNGSAQDHSSIIWGVKDGSGNIVDVTGAGLQAVVTGKKPGTGVVTATVSGNTLEILIVVEADTRDNTVYITSNVSLLDLKPDEERIISAQLMGGSSSSAYNNNNMVWRVKESRPLVGGEVISLNYEQSVTSAASVRVRGINEGSATIEVSHGLSNHVLYISVQVMQTNTLRLSPRSAVIQLGSGSSNSVTFTYEAPTGTSLNSTLSQYEGDNIAEATMGTGTILVEGLKAGVTVLTVQNDAGTLKDEVLIEIRADLTVRTSYIETPQVIYNMTDWDSALNRVTLSANVVGDKQGGGTFTTQDNADLTWAIVGGDGIIEFDTLTGVTGSTTTSFKGSQVNVRAKGVGQAEVKIDHAQMYGENYSKILYFNVTPYDGKFSLSPPVITMSENDYRDIKPFIVAQTGDNVDYGEVEWRIRPDTKGVIGLDFVDGDGNIIEGQNITGDNGAVIGKKRPKGTSNNGLSNTVIGIKAHKFEESYGSVYNVIAKYENKEYPCLVSVSKEKLLVIESLEVLGANLGNDTSERSFISILPNVIVQVDFYVQPANAEVTIKRNYEAYLDLVVDETIPGDDGIRWKDAVKERGYVQFKATDVIGFTEIRFMAENIERMVTVETTNRYAFYMNGIVIDPTITDPNNPLFANNIRVANEVRGQPGERVTIAYTVNPEGDIVTQVENTGLFGDLVVVEYVPNVSGNRPNWLTLDLKGSNFANIKFKSEYNEKLGIFMEIPVYVYYDNVSLTWIDNRVNGNAYDGSGYKKTKRIGATDTKLIKSRMDHAQQAIYIADGEEFVLTFEHESSKLPYLPLSHSTDHDALGYPGSNIKIKRINFSRSDNSTDLGFQIRGYNRITSGSSGSTTPTNNVQLGSYVLIDFADKERVKLGSEPSLVSSEYAGLLEVEYGVNNGSLGGVNNTKKFMVYKEIWER